MTPTPSPNLTYVLITSASVAVKTIRGVNPAPLVEELYRFRDRLPEKLRYLADAPQQDPEGNKTVVRFSRKTKQQYVAAEKDGKATGWSAFFVDGKWVEGKK